ncbi:hypothetical protein [Streptomyces sp. NBC_00588]|uniref:hypothetical protein n=1 Tax=Streptomyces sp. NBC_00588 TaxID=2975784 RepID=UPI002E802D90|nr:hypothetical protein [Streptomyces sp. NBC_00588]WUB37253.1 hypothetical protein OHN38_21020 [Streptomyces sp. NBC_00588]
MSSALIAAGAALGASLITGVLTWLAGRSHMSMQFEDQRDVRREQLRRETYARCIELLISHTALTLDCSHAGWEGGQSALAVMRQGTAGLSQQALSQMAELHMVGPRHMVGLFSQARRQLDDLQAALEDVLSGPRPTDERHPTDLLAVEIREAGAAVEAFCESSRQVLAFDEFD